MSDLEGSGQHMSDDARKSAFRRVCTVHPHHASQRTTPMFTVNTGVCPLHTYLIYIFYIHWKFVVAAISVHVSSV